MTELSKCRVMRDVTREECAWLPRDFREGENLYLYPGMPLSTWVTISPNSKLHPFFDFPRDALDVQA